MPSGKTHNKALNKTWPLVLGGLWLWSGDPRIGFAAAVGTACGLILSPDLDQHVRTESEWLVEVWGGKVVGFVYRLIWWPYASMIPHRHPVSHWPVLGTAGRIGYLSAALWLLSIGRLIPPVHAELFWWWAAGLVIADTVHFVMDYL